METIDILKKNELFKDLKPEELAKIADLATRRIVLRGTIVVNRGDESSSLYLIRSGRVSVMIDHDDGRRIILCNLEAGEHFGELSLLDGEPRSATITTLERSEFIIIHRTDFWALIQQNPAIAANVIKFLCHRVRRLTEMAESLALSDVYGRLRKLLHELAVQDTNGQLVISTKMTHEEIGGRIGAVRERVGQILSMLQEGGYITNSRGKITINRRLPPRL
jgi:CRP/FNR family transcriptional regulator, cyclic AMP receptor protein